MSKRRNLRALLGSGILLALASPWWSRALEPYAVARDGRGPLLARAMRTHDPADYGALFERPGGLGLYAGFVRRHPDAADVNVLIPETIRAELGQGVGFSDIRFAAALGPGDYDAVVRWREERSEPESNFLLALDFPRARREVLAHPTSREDLYALSRWGVPVREILPAVARLPKGKGGYSAHDEAETTLLLERLRREDQTRATTTGSLFGGSFPSYSKRVPPPDPTFRGDLPLSSWNLDRAQRLIERDPGDPRARAWLRRLAVLPLWSREVAIRLLAGAGDPEGLRLVGDALGSANGGRVQRGLDTCGAPPTFPLLARLEGHPWLWVRIQAARLLAENGASQARRFADDPARDVRLAARKIRYFVNAEMTTSELPYSGIQ